MKKIKLCVIFGTRPEAIKLAPLILNIKKNNKKFNLVVINSGQHSTMLNQVIKLFNIQVDFNLKVMKKNQNLSDLTSQLFKKIHNIVAHNDFDMIVVQGDTTTALVGAMVAFYNRIEISHIEAGLRTFDLLNPFPEEMNRRFISSIATLNFAPTKIAKFNLMKENISPKKIYITGNTVVDALDIYKQKSFTDDNNKLLKELGLDHNKFNILLTCHRRESFGQGIKNICLSIKEIALKYQHTNIIFPVHLNPNIKNIVLSYLNNCKNIHLVSPLDYRSLLFIMSKVDLIVTDSGGIQEEAPSFNVPVLVTRNFTERPEGIHSGVARLIGTDKESVFKYIEKLITDQRFYRSMISKTNPYGDGKASKKICKSILEYYD
jgi:UDP-N-acetylglucosamine 2-epimerase (non-hydrolysing)